MTRKRGPFTVDTGGVDALLNGLSGRFDRKAAGHSDGDGTTADRHDGTTVERQNGKPSRRQPKKAEPAAARSKYTLLLDQDDALTLDQLALDLRRRTGRPVDRSEILRTLIRLADSHPATTDALGAALDRRPTTD